MRKITPPQILVFITLLVVILLATACTTRLLYQQLPAGDWRGLVSLGAGLVCFYLYAILLHRLMLWRFPLRSGEIDRGSQQEFVYHVYLLFYLVLFYPITRSGFVPVPIMRLFYQALGARLGANSYSSGIIFDPLFVQMGRDCIVGQYALLIPHVIEGERLAHYPIRLGDNVTIGAHAVITADVIIENGATVAIGAVVTKGTRIGAGEIWGGVPARRLGTPKSSGTPEE